MGYTQEIYLTKKFISQNEWLDLIKIISNYNGILKSWRLIIKVDESKISYHVQTSCSLPSTINNLSSFILKSENDINLKYNKFSAPYYIKLCSNIIDIINKLEIKIKGELKYIEIDFIKIYDDKILHKVYLYIKKEKLKKYRMLFGIPTCILSVDFEGNKRYFYKSAPKYLDINKILHLLKTDSSNALFKVDTFPYLQGDFYLSQNDFNFDKHSVIMGSSGCGKSKFISSIINNINKNSNLKSSYKIVLIDPHASLENDIGGLGKVIDFDLKEDSLDLFINKKKDVISSTELLLDLFESLISDQYNSKLERVLRHSIYLLLTNESFNFNNLRKLLLELEYRNEIIKKLKYDLPISVIDFFLSDFNDLKTRSYSEAISPIISFIDEMQMIPAFNEDYNINNLENIINDNFLTIFSLDRTKLGSKVIKTISGLIMNQLFSLIQNYTFDKHIIFIIDEVSTLQNKVLSRYLSESRKYNLSLVLAGQYFNQITEDLQKSIFANTVNYYMFRLSKLDAQILVDNFNMKIPLDDSKEKKIKMLSELNNRECIVRIQSNDLLMPVFKAKTLDFNSIPRLKKKSNKKEKNEKTKDKKVNFEIGNNINLREILIKTSSSRKVVK